MVEYEKAKKAAEFGMQTDSVGYDECILIGNLTKAADEQIELLQETYRICNHDRALREIEITRLKEELGRCNAQLTACRQARDALIGHDLSQ